MFSLALYKDKVCFEIQVFKKNLRCWVSVTETKDTSAIMLTKVEYQSLCKSYKTRTHDIITKKMIEAAVYYKGVTKL